MLASAWITERLGIHALFGAFLIGVNHAKESAIRPRHQRKAGEPYAGLLLPLYFAFNRIENQHRTLERGGYVVLLRNHHRGRDCG